jgi:tetratricopeptide (TPR) repeat protein
MRRGESHRLIWAVVLGVALLPFATFGQADEREEIISLTEKIQKDPKNAALFRRRGEMHRTVQNWDAAQSDYDKARDLDPKAMDDVDFLKGRLYLEANWPTSAKVALDRFLAKHKDHMEALIARARAHSKLGQRKASSDDYARALQLAPQPQPEFYLERAQTIAAGGDDHLTDAVNALDEGVRKLGPLPTLQLAAIDIEVRQRKFDAALARIDSAAATTARKETWLARKGDILRQAGRTAEAREAYRAALKALETLPPARRNVPATAALEKRIRDEAASLK